MKKIICLLAACLAITACAPKVYRTQQTVDQSGSSETVTKKTMLGSKELSTLKEQYKDEIITADGEAVLINKYPEMERNKQLAKKGAMLDAQRKLAEKISLIKLNASTTMKDFETSDFVQSRVNTFLKDVEVLSETYDEKNKLYKVSIQMPKVKLVEVLEEYLH